MRKFIIAASALVAASAAFGQFLFQRSPQEPPQMQPAQKLGYAEKIIETYYVDTVNTDKLVQDAIVAMLKNLDPHSTYSDPEETKELTQPLEGNFSGIGVQFNMLNDTLFVIQTTAGGPSEKVGILPGDRILQAGDSLISGVKSPNSRILKILRGPKGTRVNLKVLRKGVREPIMFSVVRDDIPIYSVDAAYMADPETGYIRISRFAEETAAEFDKAFSELKKQGMKNLIVDLEDNGGGYLGAAHDLASRFLRRGDLVVYTDGPQTGTQVYGAERDGYFLDGRLVVMVNQYSASASEITAGAVQDNDRGLIVGRRTFGKGLVQRPFPFPDGSMIRLTVAHYYTPTGRDIQKPYKKGDQRAYALDIIDRFNSGELMHADSVKHVDSLRVATKMLNRTVYGGGGIYPDSFVGLDTTENTRYYRNIMAKGILLRYAAEYADTHRKELRAKYKKDDDFVKHFEVSDAMLDEIRALAEAEKVEYNAEEAATSAPLLRMIIKALIGRDAYDTPTYFKVYNEHDPIFREARRLINSPDYDRLLSAPAGEESSGRS